MKLNFDSNTKENNDDSGKYLTETNDFRNSVKFYLIFSRLHIIQVIRKIYIIMKMTIIKLEA
jgi:hypothetical protein